MELYWYKAKVVKVIDGDTLDIDVDLGFDVWHCMRVRLNGINAAESRTSNLEEKKLGLEAKEYVKTWFDKRGYEIKIRTFKDKTEKYGRVLAEVYDLNGLDCLNTDMIESNMAKPYFGEKRS